MSEKSLAERVDDACIGEVRDGDYCPHRPEFIVGGDLACYRHLPTILRQRAREIGRRVVRVEVIGAVSTLDRNARGEAGS